MEQPNALSDKLVLFIGIVFAVVIAESFARYSSLILHPAASPLGFVGLLAIYMTIVSSWIRYHRSALKYPYKECSWSWLRFSCDFIIVGLYAYLLYSLAAVEQLGNLVSYLWGFVAIFFLYVPAGVFRRKEHADPKASNWKRLVLFSWCFVVLAVVYQFVVSAFFPTTLEELNWLFLVIPPLLNIAFTIDWWRAR